ncbi:MAG: hypothetical protein KGJ62_10040 [Armatimonadetes bacterium]|nr:hypothetical protein [Armatimonadota bacterium]MDE2206689.1 hypothetical protein [Armatimonadota bacterium]
MANTPDPTPLRIVETQMRTCVQCGHSEAVCDRRGQGNGARAVSVCPLCGHTEEEAPSGPRSWPGFGVFVTVDTDGRCRARAFAQPIPDADVCRLTGFFRDCGEAVRFVSRWDQAAGHLDILIDAMSVSAAPQQLAG